MGQANNVDRRPIDGKTAERIGLVMKSVPAEVLEEEVMTLAKRITNISLEMLIPNKSLINKVMDLMGHDVAEQLAADTAIITHHAQATRRFHEMGACSGDVWYQQVELLAQEVIAPLQTPFSIEERQKRAIVSG